MRVSCAPRRRCEIPLRPRNHCQQPECSVLDFRIGAFRGLFSPQAGTSAHHLQRGEGVHTAELALCRGQCKFKWWLLFCTRVEDLVSLRRVPVSLSNCPTHLFRRRLGRDCFISPPGYLLDSPATDAASSGCCSTADRPLTLPARLARTYTGRCAGAGGLSARSTASTPRPSTRRGSAYLHRPGLREADSQLASQPKQPCVRARP